MFTISIYKKHVFRTCVYFFFSCAPEVARRHQYSTAGDVWSYGVLLWEMFSFGDSSWENLTDTEV